MDDDQRLTRFDDLQTYVQNVQLLCIMHTIHGFNRINFVVVLPVSVKKIPMVHVSHCLYSVTYSPTAEFDASAVTYKIELALG